MLALISAISLVQSSTFEWTQLVDGPGLSTPEVSQWGREFEFQDGEISGVARGRVASENLSVLPKDANVIHASINSGSILVESFWPTAQNGSFFLSPPPPPTSYAQLKSSENQDFFLRTKQEDQFFPSRYLFQYSKNFGDQWTVFGESSGFFVRLFYPPTCCSSEGDGEYSDLGVGSWAADLSVGFIQQQDLYFFAFSTRTTPPYSEGCSSSRFEFTNDAVPSCANGLIAFVEFDEQSGDPIIVNVIDNLSLDQFGESLGTASQFGYQVEESNGRLYCSAVVISDPFDGYPESVRGIVVLENFSGSWQPTQWIAPEVEEPGSLFGNDFAISPSGQFIAVGAAGVGRCDLRPASDDLDCGLEIQRPGSVVLFEQNLQGGWDQVAVLRHPDPVNRDQFGHALCWVGETLAVARRSNRYDRDGSVVLFEEVSSSWEPVGVIQAPEHTLISDGFAWDIDSDGDVLAIGQPFVGLQDEGQILLYDVSSSLDPFDAVGPDRSAATVRVVEPLAVHDHSISVATREESLGEHLNLGRRFVATEASDWVPDLPLQFPRSFSGAVVERATLQSLADRGDLVAGVVQIQLQTNSEQYLCLWTADAASSLPIQVLALDDAASYREGSVHFLGQDVFVSAPWIPSLNSGAVQHFRFDSQNMLVELGPIQRTNPEVDDGFGIRMGVLDSPFPQLSIADSQGGLHFFEPDGPSGWRVRSSQSVPQFVSTAIWQSVTGARIDLWGDYRTMAQTFLSAGIISFTNPSGFEFKERDPNALDVCGAPCRPPLAPYSVQAYPRYSTAFSALPEGVVGGINPLGYWADSDVICQPADRPPFRVVLDRDLGLWVADDPIEVCPGLSSKGCSTDLDRDGLVGYLDLIQLLTYWSQGDLLGDVDCSTSVGLGDLILLISTWGACP